MNQVAPDTIAVVDPPQRYAVVLNARARGWTGSVHEAVQRFVPRRDLFLTEDFRQAQTMVQKVLDRDYDAIFTGGGDGTVVYLINAIEEQIQAGKIAREDAPPVGVLRLGTGNAIATYLGAGPIIEDLEALHAGTPLQVRRVSMVRDGESRFPFAGFGWDADILNDYHNFKDAVQGSTLEKLATGLGGYGVSIATRTMPKAILRGSHQVKFTNLGPRALALDEYGQVIEERGEGEVLYEGPIKITSPSTIPFWGFNIRMFPYTSLRPGMFELRYYTGSIGRVLVNLRGFWKGRMPPQTLGDWLVTKVRVEIEDGTMSYQVAGDAAGYRDDVVWEIAEHPAYLAIPFR